MWGRKGEGVGCGGRRGGGVEWLGGVEGVGGRWSGWGCGQGGDGCVMARWKWWSREWAVAGWRTAVLSTVTG